MASFGNHNNSNNESNPDFYQRHRAMFDSCATSGKVWQQDIHAMLPFNKQYQEISVFTAWQHAYFTEATQEFTYLQAWPRLLASGEIAWAMQVSIVGIQGDSYRYEGKGKSAPILQPPTYSMRFKGPVIIDTAGIVNADYFQGATSDTTLIDDFWDPVTHEPIMNHVITILKPKEKRYYTVTQVIKAQPPYFPEDAMLLAYFDSHAETPPAVISSAFSAYNAGIIPLRPDPNAPPGYPNIYLYIPSIDGNGPFVTPENPECDSSKNHGFKGGCFYKSGQQITTKQ